jgi:hypothetical protein
MKVVCNKKSYSEKQLRKNRFKKYCVSSVFFIVMFLLIKYAVLPILNFKTLLNGNFLLILILMLSGTVAGLIGVGMSVWLESFLAKVNNDIGVSMAGHDGEQKVFKELGSILNDKYTVYPNYIVPGHKFDLDFLIVGPKGLIVVEVKNFSNATVFTEDKALSIKESGYKQEVTKLVGSADPRTKLETHCKVLNNYLNYLDFDNIKIKKVLVFARDHVTIEGKSKIYIVKKISDLRKYFNELYNDERFTTEFCKEINAKLL